MPDNIEFFKQQSVKPSANWRDLQRQAFLGENPNIGKTGADQFGNPMTDPSGNALSFYRDADYRKVAGDTQGAIPVYGSTSATITPELRSPQQYRDYLGSDQYSVQKESAERQAANQASSARFRKGLIGVTGLAMGGIGALGALGGAGLSGIATGNAPTAAASTGGGFWSGLGGEALKGAALGGAQGYLQGGDLKSAARGAAIGGVTGAASPYISKGFSSLGVPTEYLSTATGAATGALKGYGAGGTGKDALYGAIGGGIGGYLGGRAEDFGYEGGSAGGEVGRSSNIPRPPGLKPSAPQTGFMSGISNIGKGVGNMNLSSLGDMYSSYSKYKSQDDIRDDILEQQRRTEGLLNPYQQSGLAAQEQLAGRQAQGYNMSDYMNSPAYKFQLEQGNQMLDRRLSASGQLDSGAALKAAQEYGQGVASQGYGEDYSRWLAQNQQLAQQAGQGYQAAGSLGNVYDTTAMANAMARTGKTSAINEGLSSLFGNRDENQFRLSDLAGYFR